MKIRELLSNLFKSAYVRMLESECDRLRAENRALMASLLGTHGYAPFEEIAPLKPISRPTKESYLQMQRRKERESMNADTAKAGN